MEYYGKAHMTQSGDVPVVNTFQKMFGTNFRSQSQGSTTISVTDNDTLKYSYSGGSSLGTCSCYPIAIDKTKYKSVKVKVSTGASAYSTADLYQACCGIRKGYSLNAIGKTSTGWLKQAVMSELNHDYEFEIGLDDITEDDIYFYICGGGWNFEVTEWGFELNV